MRCFFGIDGARSLFPRCEIFFTMLMAVVVAVEKMGRRMWMIRGALLMGAFISSAFEPFI
jgi:hypothetical protein